MLEIKSKLWEKLHSSISGNGLMSMNLLNDIAGGDESAFDELLNQVCHQFKVEEVAYAAVPHLVEIAKNGSRNVKIESLRIVGYVAASIGNDSFASNHSNKIPEHLKDFYNKAIKSALQLATELINEKILEKRNSLEVMGVISALSGHANFAMIAFMAGYDSKIECPECGEYIEYKNR